MSIQEEIQSAIEAHARWKRELHSAIETGKSEFAVENVCQDDRCTFGKWLYAQDEATAAAPRFKCIRTTHADFHLEAARILGLALEGRKDEAKKAFAYGSKFTGISNKLTAEMTAWKREAAHLTVS